MQITRQQATNRVRKADDTIDQMRQTAKATLLYETRAFEAPMRRMGDIIVQAAELTQISIPLLRSMHQNASPG